jgi:hypothetical protein
VRLVALVVACASCTSAQARAVKRVADVVIPASMFGVLVPTAAGVLDRGDRPTLITIGSVFVPITIIATVTWVIADSLIEQETPARRTSPRADAAMDLAKQAKRAARAGDCAEVQAIEPRVRALDDGIYLRFLRDPVIRPCRATVSE